ncbi:hypothetical protein [Schlesneria paludicola]|uniref:hypothetical protein n=1 Tax=Schlesneria paludicola TaxID=360056 RepID=UPI00029A5A66|nr:hypothetical protein [Schlesneria paludicola]
MSCSHVSFIHRRQGLPDLPIFHCENGGRCIRNASDLTRIKNLPDVKVCSGEISREIIVASSKRPKANFAYFTGTNRGGQDNAIIATMLRSMREAGVKEDLHVFSPEPVAGAIHHKIKQGYPWKHHMAKLEFLAELTGSSYDYCVWLDSDNYFTRDPGDLKPLIRENPLWVQMESDATSPKVRQKDWYSLSYPQLVALFREEGVKSPAVWNSNGGFWIVRTSEIVRVVSKAFELYERFHAKGWKNAPDEMVLACIGAMWVDDPYLNTNERTCDIWACDWIGRYRDRIPDGRPWLYEDWLNGSTRTINPAIVHAMRSKTAMAIGRDVSRPQPIIVPPREPVGTKLKDVIEECGLKQPAGCSCNTWVIRMDQWGIDGCEANRPAILEHLADASKKSGWMDMLKVVAHGYLTTNSLLDEAIKRANQTQSVSRTQLEPVSS